MGKRKRFGEEKQKKEDEFDLPKRHMKEVHCEAEKKRMIVVLEGAQLETVKVSLSEILYILKLIKSSTFTTFRSATHSNCSTVTITFKSCANSIVIRVRVGQTSHIRVSSC